MGGGGYSTIGAAGSVHKVGDGFTGGIFADLPSQCLDGIGGVAGAGVLVDGGQGVEVVAGSSGGRRSFRGGSCSQSSAFRVSPFGSVGVLARPRVACCGFTLARPRASCQAL